MAQIHDSDYSGFEYRSVPSFALQCSLRREVAAISPLVHQLMSLIRAPRTADGSEGDIDIALREALANAIVHGNHEQHQCKYVKVICRCTIDGAVDITIRDEGDGFDNSSIPDPTAPENRMSTHGRGIYLMWALMDEIRFENRGTVVYMRKRPNAKRCEPFRTGHIELRDGIERLTYE